MARRYRMGKTIKTNICLDLVGPTKGVRENILRIQRESFKERNSNGFSHSVTVKHSFSLKRVAPVWSKLPENAVSSPS